MAAFLRSFIITWICFGIINSIDAKTKKNIRVTAMVDPPLLFEDDKGQFTGLIPDLLDKLGYNYSIYQPPDLLYGSVKANGTWAGMVGELIEQNADLSALLTVTVKRSEAIDFSFPVMSVGHSILLKKPTRPEPTISQNLSQLVSPVTLSVWLLSLLAMLVTGVVLYIIMHFSPYEWRRMARDHEATVREGESFTCMNSFFFVISTLLWQGYTHAPRSVGARILVVAWWAFTVIFIVSYTASLTNYLRFGPQQTAAAGYTQVRSFRDLARNNKIRVGMLPVGATNAFFKNSKSLVYQQIYEKATEDPISSKFRSVSELVRYLREQDFTDFSLILESNTAKYIANQPPCNLFVVNAGTAVKQIAFGLQKNSTLKEEIDKGLMRLADSGELNDLELKWYKSKCHSTVLPVHDDDSIDVPNFYPLDLGTFSTALLIVVAGIVLGSLVCIIEICIFKWAEAHPEEEETVPVVITGGSEAEPETKNLLSLENKKGGATQV